MTQHPGDVIVGSVVVTVTKPTRAQRISLVFLGQQRVYVKDTGNPGALSMYTNVDHTMFEKRLALWGQSVDDRGTGAAGPLETLPAGTQRIPFSIVIPRVNYPATIRREKACRVRYQVWAVFERPGTFKDHVLATHKEEIHFEPLAYPSRPREAVPISEDVPGSHESTTRHIGVAVTGGLVTLPAVAGERIAYQVEARTVRSPSSAAGVSDQFPTDPAQFTVKHVRLTVVERLTARGLIKGREQAQGYRRDLHSIALVPEGAEAGKTSNKTEVFSSSGHLRLPLDMCPFDSKQLKRSYELRVDCDVIDSQSLLNKVTRQKSTYQAHVPLDVCTVSPDLFDTAAFRNAYTDESRNMAAIAPPAHFDSAAEPEIRVGGWELERSFAKWDRFNPTWIELAKRRNAPQY
ncbi:hypothetical protein LPJ61_005492 [Coemansia biformis]|uniref:Arrestin-like N-terminal domain-containing protein n=1 Tax=Coemansia biformis TaxID=1286918 RepID=A0A9W7Y7A8_9FUNG|nr:hypothetical protein LPJ61_005492 [Coemansia biformis]